MTIEEFLEARWLEAENNIAQATMTDSVGHQAYSGVIKLHRQLRMILDWHKNWPVLVERPPVYDQDWDGFDVNTMTFRMSTQLKWMTQQAYVERFGTAPPTAPLLRQMVQQYIEHDDFQEEWRL